MFVLILLFELFLFFKIIFDKENNILRIIKYVIFNKRQVKEMVYFNSNSVEVYLRLMLDNFFYFFQ